MQQTNFLGEHAWAGQLGHLFTLISFAGALLATVGYFLYTRSDDAKWRTVGRIGFRAHSVAVLGIIVTLFTMLFKHWFAFDYAWLWILFSFGLNFIPFI